MKRVVYCKPWSLVRNLSICDHVRSRAIGGKDYIIQLNVMFQFIWEMIEI